MKVGVFAEGVTKGSRDRARGDGDGWGGGRWGDGGKRGALTVESIEKVEGCGEKRETGGAGFGGGREGSGKGSGGRPLTGLLAGLRGGRKGGGRMVVLADWGDWGRHLGFKLV